MKYYYTQFHGTTLSYITIGLKVVKKNQTIQCEGLNSSEDKLLREYGLPRYHNIGNEAEANGAKLIFFLPHQGVMI